MTTSRPVPRGAERREGRRRRLQRCRVQREPRRRLELLAAGLKGRLGGLAAGLGALGHEKAVWCWGLGDGINREHPSTAFTRHLRLAEAPCPRCIPMLGGR